MNILRSRRARAALRVGVVGAVLGALPVFASPSSADSTTFHNVNAIRFSGRPGTPPPWPADLYPSTIGVSGLTGAVSDVNVVLHKVDCVFTPNSVGEEYPEDVDVALVAPSGRSAVIMSDVFGGNLVTTTFAQLTITLNDEAANSLPADENPFNGTTGQSVTGKPTDDDNDVDESTISSPADPSNPGLYLDTFPTPAPSPPSVNPAGLSIFDGENPNGTWSLYVADDYAGPEWCDVTGGWSLQITTGGTAEPTAVPPPDGGATTTLAPTTTAGPRADLAASLSGPTSARVGRKISFKVTATNNGPDTAQTVAINDNLPSDFVLTSVNRVRGMTCTQSSTLVRCEVARLAPGGTVSASFNGYYKTAGTFRHTVGVSSTTQDPFPLNNRAEIDTAVK